VLVSDFEFRISDLKPGSYFPAVREVSSSMSINSLGIVSSLAATPLAQKGPQADQVQRQAVDHARQAESQSRAEVAAGIGQTEEESEASERDADGRRPWEIPPLRKADEPMPDAPPAAIDQGSERGGLIDISG
jgi:hypothetical protein